MLKTLIKFFLRYLGKPLFGLSSNVAYQRAVFVAFQALLPAPRGVRREPVRLGGIPTQRMTPRKPGAATVLYLHGGGYCIGSAWTYRATTGHLARAAPAVVYAPDYRLAPEHPHPAALEDALVAYRALLALDIKPSRLIVAGDSAGAGLAVATAVAVRDAGLPLPAALALISPWVDLACSGATYASVGHRDPILTEAFCKSCAVRYLAGRSAQDPACSPLYADLRGLPPLLIQVGSEEIVLDDSRRLHERARAAGVDSRLHEYPGLWHDFQWYAGVLREADQAVAEIGEFVRKRCAG